VRFVMVVAYVWTEFGGILSSPIVWCSSSNVAGWNVRCLTPTEHLSYKLTLLEKFASSKMMK